MYDLLIIYKCPTGQSIKAVTEIAEFYLEYEEEEDSFEIVLYKRLSTQKSLSLYETISDVLQVTVTKNGITIAEYNCKQRLSECPL